MTPLAAFGTGLATAVLLLTLVWVIQLFTRNAGLVDVVWSAALGLIGAEYALFGDAPAGIRILLAALALSWALRLAGYLARRMRGAPEDSRYAAARESWGRKADVYLLGFFVFQAVIASILSIPFLVIAYMPAAPSLGVALAAVAIWFISVIGEGTADAQLHHFKQKRKNRGHVCTEGLWRYSRHPNYFFESLHWVTYVVLAIGAPYWWATLASPVIMAWLLLRVSGIPTIENKKPSEKRQGHDEYVRRTSAFIPWPPKA
jgi:steroid 5-alpha reductase family enzyme